MYKLLCPCLNITIHAQKGGERQAEGKTFLSKAITSSAFFADNVLEIKLAVGGITKEVPTLVQCSHIGDWDVHTCINCKTEVYALHAIKGYDRVLVNEKLESDALTIKELATSDEFSPVFKIILKTEKQEKANDQGYAVLVNRDQVAHSMNSIQELVKKYLNAEEQAMEKKIKEYAEEQKKLFGAVKARAFQDKITICRVLADVDASLMEMSLHEAINETTKNLNCNSIQMPQPPHNYLSHGFTKNEVIQPPFKFTGQSPSKSPFTQKKVVQGHRMGAKTTISAPDADPMFALDGFNEDCEPFFESEEDELSSSDNSFQMEEATVPRRVSAVKKSLYSSSAPISLPRGAKASRSWEDDDDDNEIPEPSKIGESMKALARSVQYNTEELFGELPRPRLFTEPRLYIGSHGDA